MRRVPLLLLAYLAASLAGGVAFVAIMTLGAGGSEAPSFVAILSVLVAALGATVAAPVAVPTILATERWGKGPWWVFLLAGLAVAALIASIQFWFFGANLAVADISGLLSLAVPPAAAMTFWFIAWHRNPPKQKVAPLAEVFE